MNLSEVRKKVPALNGLNDQDAIDVLHQAYYPDTDKAKLSAMLGVAPPEAPPAPQAGIMRTAGDVGIKLAQGAVDLGSAAVGIGSLATGGLIGKGARAIGYDPKRTNEALGEYLSDSQKASDAKVAQADGFVDSIAAAVQNPRAILGSIAESAPGMLAGMGVQSAVARGIATRAALATGEGAAASAAQLAAGKTAAQAAEAALATKAGGSAAKAALDASAGKLIALGAATEGAQSAGQIADEAQAAGRAYSDYALPALAAGAGTAGIGLAAGKLMGDSATQIATGSAASGVKGNIAKRAAKEFVSEGVLEEMPQSAQEQYFTNIAQGEQDHMKGVGNAAGTGLVTGGVMGVGLGGFQHNNTAPAPLPNTGPLSQAANAGQAAAAAKANAMAPAAATPAQPSLAEIDARMAQIVAIGQGQLAKKVQAPDGSTVTVPAVAGRALTAEEKAEYESLKKARAERTAIPADQQSAYQALLDEEQAAINAKHAETMQAAAQARDQAETDQIKRMLAEDEKQARAKTAAEQQAAIAQTDTRVAAADAARAAANRAALRDAVINDATIAVDDRPAAFQRALEQDGYINTALTDEDSAVFAEAATPLPSMPNELTDAVPERRIDSPVGTPAKVNTDAVDKAIAAGMRLKTVNGNVLHKPGSTKIFKLSTAQKEYYLQAIAKQDAQAGATQAVAAPDGQADAATPAAAPPQQPAEAQDTPAATIDAEIPHPIIADIQAQYAVAADQWNINVAKMSAAREAGDQAEMSRIKAVMDPIYATMKGLQGRLFKAQMALQSAKNRKKAAQEAASQPIGARLRPSEFPEEKGIHWEKTAENEWTARGEFRTGEKRTDAEVSASGGLVPMPPVSPNSKVVTLAGKEVPLSSLYLVRVQNNFAGSQADNGTLRLSRNSEGRNTFHFTINSIVENHAYGKFDGEAVVIAPLAKALDNGQVPSGFGVADTWFNADKQRAITLPDSTLIAPEGMTVPEGANVIWYAKGESAADTQAARDAAVQKFFSSNGAQLHQVGFDGWRDGSVSEAEYRHLLAEFMPTEIADKVFIGRHSNSADGRIEDLVNMTRQAEKDAKDGATLWENMSGVQLPIQERIDQLKDDLRAELRKAIESTSDGSAQDHYQALLRENAPNQAALEEGAHAAATSPQNDLPEPTAAQKEAGNYQKGHVRLHGMDIAIENPIGSVRRGVDRDGTPWENTMQSHYGYIKGSEGADGDHVDVFIGPDADSTKVYVVDQVHPDNRKFDEHKVMLGFNSPDDALRAYSANYAAGWEGGDKITSTDIDGLKEWLASGKTKQPFAKGAPRANVHKFADMRQATSPEGAKQPVEKAAPAAPPAPEAAPKLTKQQLNRKTVKEMSDAELLQARTVLAGGPRDAAIAKEIKARSIDDQPAAASAVTANGTDKDGKVAAPKAKATPIAPAETKLRSDFGVEHIDGYAETAEFPFGDQNSDRPSGGVKAAFISDAKRYLSEVGVLLLDHGFAGRPDKKGKPAKPVSVNEAGPAVSGDISLNMFNKEADIGVYINISGGVGGMGIPATQSGVTVMYRLQGADGRDKGQNNWAPTGLTAEQMTGKVLALVENYLKQRASAINAEQVPAISAPAATESAAQPPATVEKLGNMPDTEDQKKGQDNNDSTDSSDTATINSPVADGERPLGSETPARGVQPARERDGQPDDGGLRESGGSSEGADDGEQDLGNRPGADAVPDRSDDTVAGSNSGVPASDYRPHAGQLTREGSWFDTARRNIDLIELALRIEQEGRPATPDEQQQLAQYVGFGAGPIRNVLFPVPPEYAKRQDPQRLIWPQFVAEARWRALAERMEALPREWQKSVLQSSQYAHYTSEGIVRSIWSAMQRMGFTGGRVFEPGMGIGNFAMLMPDSVHDTSNYTGVEFDGPTATIARLLSPKQNILHDDFIKRKFPRDYFDIAIGNPPFSQTKVFGDPDYEKAGFMLHDFFFAKSIDRVRPGGLLAFVTSKGTMDKQSDRARKYLADRADLIGAIRLPSTAFESNAGTSVVTDVIFLRKRAAGEQPAGAPWANIATVETKDGTVAINEYFANNPEMVLGQNRISGNVDDQGRRINSNGQGGEKYTVVSYDATPAELDQKFAAAIERLPANVYSVMGQDAQSIIRETAKMDFDPSVKREGVIYVGKNDEIMRVENGVGRPLSESATIKPSDVAWFKSYIGLRDLVQEARMAQVNNGNWKKALKRLNDAYDAFRAEHGPINAFRVQVRKSTDEDGKPVEVESRIFTNRRRYREDYDAAIVTQLETINEAGEVVKAPFLLNRTIGLPTERKINSVGDALAVSLDTVGKLDLNDVARRMGFTREEAISALDNQVYQTPAGEWQLADEYLSGDVVAKLEEAEQAARLDPSLRRNVEALIKAQPEKLGPSQISAKLGSSWIPVQYVNEFAAEIEAGEVSYDPKTETWQVDGGNLRTGRRAGAEYGTAKRSPSELLEAVLNSRPIKVTAITEDKKTVTDTEATVAANEAAKKIKDKFKSWVWTDADRAADLVEMYNRRYNNLAPRRFDGSHLTLPGVSLRYNLHPHQKNGIYRVIQTGDTYLAHAVGAGKTMEMIAAGMEQKRLGLIKKPMYVVPNHMLEQFSNEFMDLYPLANIMVADDTNFSAERRKAFIASATLNNPDAVIITHDAFQRIGVKEESVAPIRDEILLDLELELQDTAKGNDTRVRRSQLEQQIEAVTQRFDRIISAGGKDSTIKFEDIGVDFIFADEAHVYRKLDFHTSQQIKGIDPNGSKRALDMYVKTRYLESRNPGRAMVFASGTPITNTMGELYTIMRFFAPNELDRAGISTFDAWSRMFGEVAPALEPNAAGKYELVERFAKFDNVPELMSRVRQFMDVLTSEHLGALIKRPDLAGGKPNLNVILPTEALQQYMTSVLGPRIEKSKRWKPSKDEPANPDPIVAIITDGRFAALDPRFFGGKIANDEETILSRMAQNVIKTYHDTAENIYIDKNTGEPEPVKGATQMVFYNLGFGAQSQASRGFNSRSAFTKLLTDGGVKRDEIAWFDDADTDAKKEAIFKGMRNGTIRVLIGSAKKMGTGVNAQKRLIQLHYQDPPWYPSDVEQPHGRIIRQGNQNKEVDIQWYTTKGTYQSTMWQMVARKQRFIDQAFSGDKSMRSMDDLGEASLFEQAAAVASGDPRAVQLAGLKQDVTRLERLQAAHANEQIAVRNAINGAEWSIRTAQNALNVYGAAYKIIGERHFSFTDGVVQGATFDKPGEFGQALKDAFNQISFDAAKSDRAVEDKQIAVLGNGVVTLTMDSELSLKGEPTGTMELNVNIGSLSIPLTKATAMGVEVDAVGLARRAINAVNGIESEIRAARQKLADAETDMVRLRKKRGAPFEYQQELAEKYAELQQLEEALRLEGQAAAQAAAEQVAAQDAVESPAPEADGRDSGQEQSNPEDAPAGAAPTQYFRNDGTFSPEQISRDEADAGEATPAEMSGKELVAAMKDVEQLNRALKKEGMAPVRILRQAPSAQFALARKIGAALGIPVHIVSGNGGFEGVAHKGVAYLGADMRSPELAIAGHEMLHTLEQTDPAMGNRLREQIRAYLRSGVVEDRQAREYVASGFKSISERQAEGEVLADINGAMWLDPKFWNDLAKADRNLFRSVAYKFMEVAAGAIKVLRAGRFDVTHLVTDVEAVRSIMVSAWAAHVTRSDAQATAKIVKENSNSSYNDPYESAILREETTEQQLATGRAAVADLEKFVGVRAANGKASGNSGTAGKSSYGSGGNEALDRRIGANRLRESGGSGGSKGTVLGSRLLANFVAGKPNQLLGEYILTPADLAALAQVYRDPRFETFRVVYMRGINVVGETGFTARLPGVAPMPPNWLSHIAQHMQMFNADGYYVMHNHPSGRASASEADIDLTKHLAKNIPGLKSHVIIDHNEYGLIDPNGVDNLVSDPSLNGIDFTGNPELQHKLLGIAINTPKKVAHLAKSLQIPAGHATLVTTNSHGEVQLLVDVPMGAMDISTPLALVKAKGLIRRMARESGASGHRFIVLPSGVAVDQFSKWLEAGIVKDIVSADGESALNRGAIAGQDVLRHYNFVYGVGEKISGLADTESPAFKQWFKNSKVVAADGAPLVVYHGTKSEFSEFQKGGSAWTDGIFFTSSERIAHEVYAGGLDAFNEQGLRDKLNSLSDAQITKIMDQAHRDLRHFDYYDDFSADNPSAREGLINYLKYSLDPDEGIDQMVDRVMQHFGVESRVPAAGSRVIPVYLSLQNPLVIDAKGDGFDTEQQAAWFAKAKESGHDGLIIKRYDDGGHGGAGAYTSAGLHDVYVAFKPEQIKSADNNNGDFDSENADINFSRSNLGDALASAANNAAALRLPAGYLVGDLFNKSGKISWWHKTVGTMENLAKRHPLFAPVYEAVQSFLGDVSRFGVAAADMAPTLLPKLEDIADIIGKNRKKPLTAADTKAIAAPIFEGTLTWARDAHGKPVKVAQLEAEAENMTLEQKAQILIAKGVIDDQQNKAWLASPLDFYENVINKKFAQSQLAPGIVWSDAELASQFQLNEQQIKLYREFRAAIDKSLTNLTITEMVKLGGKDAIGTLEHALKSPDLGYAARYLRDHFVELARMSPDKADMHLDTAKQIMDLADRGISLMDRGYAPLQRFGKYTVYVQKDGEQVYFGMFESQAEASKMARDMRAAHPDAEVLHGTVSEDAYKLFAGVSPETIELFGSMVGLDSQADAASTEVYQSYLKLAKANRSAMKRMIERKGIDGFSEDAGRVLASFIYSNARLSAGNAHLGKIDTAVSEIPKQQGELIDAAMQLRESIRNPEGGGAQLGGLMFAQFLGGSIASAMVNLTQPLTMTLPYLSQFGGIAAAGRRLSAAVRDAAKKGTGDAALDEALQWAADEGIVAPQEIHYLQAQASGKGALQSGDGTRVGNARAGLNNALSKLQLGWGKLFAMAELTNRRVTFIAAYRTAVEQGIDNPARFAEQAVSQTQGTYNSGNKPRWARNPIGGLLMTFKQYSIGYLELLTRMATAGEKGSKERAAGQRAALYMIAVLFLMSGADGLPFEDDLEDVIDGALQRLGYNFSTKRAKQAFLTDVLGQGGAAFVLKGVSSMPGMPIDVAGRFGMGNLIPGTGLLTKKESYTSDLGELAGPAGDIAKRAFTATGKALGGDLAGAALDLSPAAIRNAVKGADMIATGAYKDARGYKVNDVSPLEGVMKIVGFQPSSTANIQDAKGQALDMIAQNRMRSNEIAEHWAQGIAANDPAMIAQARQWRDDWNAKNPETPIRVNMPAVIKRVRNMRQDVLNRTQKTAPAALKVTVRNELSDVVR